MGNTPGKPHSRERNKKYLQLKGAERPHPPGKPYLVAVEDGTPDVLTIRWDPPLKLGGTHLTGYYVEHRRTGSPHWVKASPVKVHETELTLSGLEPGWRYQFRVFAENLVGLSDPSELSDPLTVTHQRSAVVAPKFTKELQDTIALENDKVEFVAHFVGQPIPKLCWFKDGFEIFSSRRTRILTEHDRSVLTIHQSAICDEGEIKCTATNKVGHVSTKARLTLEAPPSIRLPRQYEDGLLFEIGELLRLKVSVAGRPTPLIFWSHNGDSLNESERYIIDNDGNSSTLRINEALRSDRGEYHIRAVNKLGTDVASFLVTVTDKPSPPGSAKVVMSLGKSVTLSWNTPNDDGGCKIGNYIVEYYRLGWNVWLKAATTKQLTTILGDLIEGSEYKFRVKAESPFGVSEPSQETELVFIPDPKRGMLEPAGGRGRSQPKDIIDELAPIATKRKKPRSQSSPRTGGDDVGSPPRPSRFKLSSPPRTPEFSPKPERKESNINKAIFDRESMYHDLSYGSPDLKIKRTDIPPGPSPVVAEVKPMTISTTTMKAATLPTKEKPPTIAIIDNTTSKSESVSPVQFSVKDRSPSPSHYVQKGDTHKFVKDKSPNSRKVLSRDNSENLGGSTEFMMVLYPVEIKESEGTFEDDGMSSVPPPLSLSAPELGIEPPQLFDAIKYSASSTELLHERAMVRFYQEALAEEEAIKRKLEKQDGKSSAIPKIQINEQDIAHLERKHSLRRRLSAGGTVPQNILLTQKRHSLRSTGEFSDIFGSGTVKHVMTIEEKRELMHNRQRSQSEEKEEEEFERIRSKMTELKVPPKKKISVVQEDVWEEEDYSLSEEESESELESLHHYEPKIRELTPEEEDETYHPQMSVKSKFEAPFEILTKPAKLPEPNFVPRPILKKKENGELSPPTSGSEMDTPRSRSNSLIDEYLEIQKPKASTTADDSKPVVDERNTSAIAGAGLTAAGIIISQPILQKKEAEEAKSVIDHYTDIVRTAAVKTLRIDDNPVRAALKKAAQMQARMHYSDEEDEPVPEPPKKVMYPPLLIAPKPDPKPEPPQIRKIDERFKNIEKKMETMPKSVTPPRKSRDDVYPKLPQIISKVDDTKDKTQLRKPIPEKPTAEAKPSIVEEKSRGREATRFISKRSTTQSKSPHRDAPLPAAKVVVPEIQTRSASKTRGTSKSREGSRSNSVARPPSRSSSSARPPSRSGSAMRPSSRSASKQRAERKSPSPAPMYLRKPKMCEIMTQTSTTIDSTASTSINRDEESPRKIVVIDESLKAKAQVKVRNTMDYITDLAMFAVVFWVFFFSNELLAIPFLLVAVFRQLQDELKRWIPEWIKKRWNKGKK